jgi:hypothetical protein
MGPFATTIAVAATPTPNPNPNQKYLPSPPYSPLVPNRGVTAGVNPDAASAQVFQQTIHLQLQTPTSLHSSTPPRAASAAAAAAAVYPQIHHPLFFAQQLGTTSAIIGGPALQTHSVSHIVGELIPAQPMYPPHHHQHQNTILHPTTNLPSQRPQSLHHPQHQQPPYNTTSAPSASSLPYSNNLAYAAHVFASPQQQLFSAQPYYAPYQPSDQPLTSQNSPGSPAIANGSTVPGTILSTGRPLLPHDGTAASTPSVSGEDGDGDGSTTAAGSRKKNNRARAGINPTPNDDGKFACDLCGKLYQHSKHLKRHMLRHTGARPYSCGLCGDDFARSDILKRHFEKCTVRRGNPNGIGHLDATRENRERENKRKQAVTRASRSQEGTPSADEAKGGGNRERKGSGKACDNCVKNKVGCDLGVPCSKCELRGWECTYTKNQRRSSSEFEARGDASLSPGFQPPVFDQPVGHGEEFHFPPVRHPHIHMTGQAHEQQRFEQQTPASSTSASVPVVSGLRPEELKLSERSQQLPHASPLLFDNGKLQSGRIPAAQDLLGWHNLVPTYMGGGFFPTQDVEPSAEALVPQSGNAYDSLLYSYAPNPYPRPMDPMPLLWTPDSLVQHELQPKCDRIITFLFSDQSAAPPLSTQLQQEYAGADAQDLKEHLTPDNIEHFVHLYFENFEHHFPLIHRPTFDPARIHDGLLVAMICVGAVYSKRGITVEQVRRLLDYLYIAMTRRIAPNGSESTPELEDIQAMTLLHILLTWHGNAKQRHFGRTRSDVVVDMARRGKLFRPLDENELREEYEKAGNSYYRQISDFNFEAKGLASWSWLSWVAQERRNRCAYTVYLLDVAYVIYYNVPPKIKPDEITLPLPVDDATWEARDGPSCAACLGVSGPQRAAAVNRSGTRRPLQISLLDGMRYLMSSNAQFPRDCTNAFSKFILMHALHVQLWLHHKWTETADQGWLEFWLSQEADISTHATLNRAFQKWREVWTDDFKRQYPEPTSRLGFARDGTAYYYLGMWLLGFSDRPNAGYGPEGEPANVTLTLGMLQRVYNRAETPPVSADAEIHENYGVEDLTYDMRLLFRPMEEKGK